MHNNHSITITCALWRDKGYYEIEVALPVKPNTDATNITIDDALRALTQQHVDLNYETLIQHSIGIFGIIKNLHDPIRDQDRIEIYEPLRVDPKEARLRRLRKKA